MLDNSLLVMAEVQQVLDKGFQKCLDLGQKMQATIEREYPSDQERLHHQPETVKNLLAPCVNEFYEVLAKTIFEVLRRLQPESFEGGQRVNLYLLPGYHSYLIGRRIFYRQWDEASRTYKSYGVGLCGDPTAAPGEVEQYHDCSHSRWYRYATMPPRSRGYLPASPYHWFSYQQPRVSSEPYDLIASLTFTTVPAVSENAAFPHHKVLNLSDPTRSSQEWGKQLADMLNSMPDVSRPEWRFPDREMEKSLGPELEPKLRTARCLLISLWMHSVFKSEPPDWWEDLHAELEQQQLTSMIASIKDARADKVACDWGDKSRNRPGFKTWATIGLHPLIAAPPPPLYGVNNDTAYDQTIGWATLLCSVPLGLPFISVVRQWVRMVYGMLRSVEVGGRLRSRAPLDRAAHVARPLLHDLHKFIMERVGPVSQRAADTSAEEIAHRRFVLLELQSQSELGYDICSAAIDPEKARRQRNHLLKTLRVEPQLIESALHKVASDIQLYGTRENRAHVLPARGAATQSIPDDTYTTCLLLIGEMVRNYCEHGPAGDMSKLEINHDGRQLEIVLEGRVISSNPAGAAFALLHNVLETLGLGKTEVIKVKGSVHRWRVVVNLSE